MELRHKTTRTCLQLSGPWTITFRSVQLKTSLFPTDCGEAIKIDEDYEYGDYAESGDAEDSDEEEQVDSSIRGGDDYDYESSGESEVEEEPIDEDG